MIKAKKLDEKSKISDISVNEVYEGIAIGNKKARLNNRVIVWLENDAEKGKEIAVRIKKIKIPDYIVGEVLEGEYDIDSKQFLADTPLLRKMMPDMEKAKAFIIKAVRESRHIIVKHHFDCDGYSGALALEHAVLSMLKKLNGNIMYGFRKSPSRYPYYDYGDACRDLNNILNSNYYVKKPLFILVDIGSTDEDLFSLKKLKLYGFKIIIIDHHLPGKVDEFADVHLNPYLFGGDNNMTAGIISSELAYQISPDDVLYKYAAASAVGDKSDMLDLYNKYNKNFLKKLAVAVDFEAFHLKSMESKKLMQDFFNFENRDIVELSYNEAMRCLKEQNEILDMNKKVIKIKNKTIVVLKLDDIINKYNYPPPGKSVGYFFSNYATANTLVIGFSPGFMIIRTNIHGFNLKELITGLKSKLHGSGISGGGHEVAGSIRFSPRYSEDVLEAVKGYITILK